MFSPLRGSWTSFWRPSKFAQHLRSYCPIVFPYWSALLLSSVLFSVLRCSSISAKSMCVAFFEGLPNAATFVIGLLSWLILCHNFLCILVCDFASHRLNMQDFLCLTTVIDIKYPFLCWCVIKYLSIMFLYWDVLFRLQLPLLKIIFWVFFKSNRWAFRQFRRLLTTSETSLKDLRVHDYIPHTVW
jgi:hypothetical protein